MGGSSGPPPAPSAAAAGGDLSLNLRGGSRGTSAPSSPAKSRESLLQRVQSLTGAARDQGANLLGEHYNFKTLITYIIYPIYNVKLCYLCK